LHQHFFSTSFFGLLRRVYFYNYHTYFFEHSLQVSKESVVTLQQSRPARPAPPILPRPPHPTPPLRPTALQPWSEPMKVRKLTLTFLCCPPPPAPSPTPHPRKRRRGGVECGFLSFSCYPPSWKTPKTRKEKEKRRGGGGGRRKKGGGGGEEKERKYKTSVGVVPSLFILFLSSPPPTPQDMSELASESRSSSPSVASASGCSRRGRFGRGTHSGCVFSFRLSYSFRSLTS
jgi:hypothetical protein